MHHCKICSEARRSGSDWQGLWIAASEQSGRACEVLEGCPQSGPKLHAQVLGSELRTSVLVITSVHSTLTVLMKKHHSEYINNTPRKGGFQQLTERRWRMQVTCQKLKEVIIGARTSSIVEFTCKEILGTRLGPYRLITC